jgi:hypothetical protein
MAGANAEFVIDVAARLNGDETLSQLDAMTSELTGAGKDAEFFQEALKKLNGELNAAKAAASAANGALSDGTAAYAQLEKAADLAAKKVERLSLKGDTMSRAYLEAAKASADASGALNAQAAALKRLEADADGANSKEKKLAETIAGVNKLNAHVNKTITDGAKEWRVLGGVLKDLPGPLGKLGQSFAAGEAAEARFAARFGEDAGLALKLGIGLAGVTAAALALTVALVYGTAKIAAWAVGLADANRNAALATEAFNAMNPALAALDFAGLSKDTGQSAADLRGLAQALQGAGVSTDRMSESLKAAALAETALGKGGAQQYVALEQAAGDAQKAVDEAAKKSGGAVSAELTHKLEDARAAAAAFEQTATTKLGGIVARQMMGLGAQSQRLQQNIGELFGALDIEPVLSGMSKLVALFDKNTAAGKALQFLFDAIFQPLINQADTAATAIEAFYLGVMIGATKLYIALKPTIKAIKDFFGLDDPALGVSFETITKLGEELAPTLAVIAGVVGGVLLAVFVNIAAIIAAQVAVWYGLIKAIGFVKDAFVGVYNYLTQTPLLQIASDLVNGFLDVFVALPFKLLGYFTSAIDSVVKYLSGISFSDIGTNLMLGMVHGITAGVGAVVNAVTTAMSSAIAAAKGVLGIHSPSRVMKHEVAGNTVKGFTGGIEAGTQDAQDAMSTMLAVPPQAANDNARALEQAQLGGDAGTVARLQQQSSPADGGASGSPTAPAPAGAAGGGAGGVQVTFQGPVYFGGKQATSDEVDQLTDLVTQVLEGKAAQLGGVKKVS